MPATPYMHSNSALPKFSVGSTPSYKLVQSSLLLLQILLQLLQSPISLYNGTPKPNTTIPLTSTDHPEHLQIIQSLCRSSWVLYSSSSTLYCSHPQLSTGSPKPTTAIQGPHTHHSSPRDLYSSSSALDCSSITLYSSFEALQEHFKAPVEPYTTPPASSTAHADPYI